MQRHAWMWLTALEPGPRQLPDGLGLRRVLPGHMLIEKGFGEACLKGDIQRNPGHPYAGAGNDGRGMRIYKNIEFCRWGDIARDRHRPAHDDEMPHTAHRFRSLLDGLGDVG